MLRTGRKYRNSNQRRDMPGSTIGREGGARIQNIGAKDLEHTRIPAEGRTHHEEGAPLVCGPSTRVGLGHGQSGGVKVVGGVRHEDRRNC